MNIKIPVQNTVEIIIGDVTVECCVRFREERPAQSMEAQLVLGSFKAQLAILSGKFANEIAIKVAEELERIKS